MALNILKLCVGADSVEDLLQWQAQHLGHWPAGRAEHITRMWPKRGEELLTGGSIYWIIKGAILCRQKLIRLDEAIGSDGIRRCAIVTDPELIAVAATPKRAFQGWRYLQPNDAPPDLAKARPSDDALPAEMQAALASIGIL